MTIRMGCQTYTWQMSLEKYSGRLPHILNTIQQAGFQGVEMEICMLGLYYHDPALLLEELNKRNLQLAALTLALPWERAEETEEEKQEAERLMAYLQNFPDSLMILVQLPGKDRTDLQQRRHNTLNIINTLARRAYERGIVTAFHPNSPASSIFRTAEDYKVMFAGLDSRYVGYAPDSGHISNGGMDVLKVFHESHSLIQHVHFKDISRDKQWRVMGEGMINHPALVAMLRDSGYNGWIMVEEESEKAEVDPDDATLLNGKYVKDHLAVLI